MRVKKTINNAFLRAAALPGHLWLWMDGSLFFRGINAVVKFLQRLCAGSLFMGFISADYDETRLNDSFFLKRLYGLLNIFPKLLRTPKTFPASLARVINGSRLFNGLFAALDISVSDNEAAPKDASQRTRLRRLAIDVPMWMAAALPVAGLLVAAVGVPYLPTMVLAGLLATTVSFALFRYKFTPDITGACILLFIVVTLFCGVTSFAAESSIPIALLTSLLMFGYLITVVCCYARGQVDCLFWALAAAGGGTGLVGVYQFLTNKVDMTWVDKELFSDIGFRVYATFGNPNVYGAYLLLIIPLTAALVLYSRNKWLKLLAFGVTGLLLLNLVLSYSRGCYLALALAAAVFVLIMEKRLAAFIPAGVILLPLVLPTTVMNRLMSITNLSDTSTEYRLYIWQGTIRMLERFWPSGVGQGIEAYNIVYPFYAYNAVTAPHSHNLLLQVFVETGIVGLLIFLGVIAGFYRNMVCFLRRAGRRDKILAAAMLAAVTGFLFQGMFDYVFYNYRVMLMFFIYIGLCRAFTRTAQSDICNAETGTEAGT